MCCQHARNATLAASGQTQGAVQQICNATPTPIVLSRANGPVSYPVMLGGGERNRGGRLLMITGTLTIPLLQDTA